MMGSFYAKKGDWIEFHGKVLEETPEYVELLASDGDVIRVFRGAYRIMRRRVEVLVGGRARVITQPNACCKL